MHIDQEFRGLIPALSEEELNQLEQNILTEGIRDPLVVWQEEDILLDGHNRHSLSQKHALEYDTKYVSLSSRYEALNWIIDNQLGRRNLSAEAASYLRGKRYLSEKKEHGGDRKSESSGHNDHLKTAEDLAEQYSVSEKTIRRDAEFTNAVDSLETVLGPEFKQEILSGDLEISKKDLIQLAKNPTESARKLLEKDFLETIKNSSRKTTAQLLVQSLSNEWYTPEKYIESARQVMGSIDLDPASSVVANKTVQATEYFSEEDNGLSKEWKGRIWLNPPYGGLAQQFTDKLVQEYISGNVSQAVLLVNSHSTDTNWFQQLWNYTLCFTDHRINFESPEGAKNGSTHGSVFVYLGGRKDEFVNEFSKYGAVVERVP